MGLRVQPQPGGAVCCHRSFAGLRSMPRTIEAVVRQATRLPDPGAWVKRVGLVAARTFDEQVAGEVIEKFRALDMDMPSFAYSSEMGEHDAWDTAANDRRSGLDHRWALVTCSRRGRRRNEWRAAHAGRRS